MSAEDGEQSEKRYIGVTEHYCAGGRYIYPQCEKCQKKAGNSTREERKARLRTRVAEMKK